MGSDYKASLRNPPQCVLLVAVTVLCVIFVQLFSTSTASTSREAMETVVMKARLDSGGTLAAPVIPISPDGYSIYRTGRGGVAIDFYIDLACSETKDEWENMRQISELFPDQVEVRYHILPLPYHQSAFAAAKAAQVVKAYATDSHAGVYDFMSDVIANQEAILNGALVMDTASSLQHKLSVWAEKIPGVSAQSFAEGMSNRNIEMATRYQFKFCLLQAAWATPLAALQGLFVPKMSWQVSEWESVLSDLIKEQGKEGPKDSSPT